MKSALGVSRETEADLRIYAEELAKWQRSINLVGPETMDDAWNRHFLDSLQLKALMPAGARSLLDLGSGAGFPGLVLAVAWKGVSDAHVQLVESNNKKCAFLRAVIQRTGAPATVHTQRIEQYVIDAPQPNVVTARALAPLDRLLSWCEPLLIRGAVGLFPKGRDLAKELVDAARFWEIGYDIVPSVIAEDSAILRIASLKRKP